MRLLCDTQILIWAMMQDAQLSARAAALIIDRRNEVLFSIVSLWEVAIKVRVGKIRISVEALDEACGVMGMKMLTLDVAHLTALSRMRDTHHNDPFDHLLIAQSVAEGASLLTSDRAIQRYPMDVIKA